MLYSGRASVLIIGMGDDQLTKLEKELNYAALNSLITLTIFELQRSLEFGAIIAEINILPPRERVREALANPYSMSNINHRYTV